MPSSSSVFQRWEISCSSGWPFSANSKGFSSVNYQVERANNSDLHCVDWNPHDPNLILTGSADQSVRMFDCRNLISNGVGSPIQKFERHKSAVLCVQDNYIPVVTR
ncbi:hypothetical protein Vadar_007969 [Vaccinium darrowii]|uniref:Uncharacterized protein n=1 Tax=Vaccinium darrowii TaxID=229202 RepID=A0ACB7Z2N3_9ERIC|nr:hypothetical protein Vadar_007969 [Vaccinium darrowii]